MTDRVSPQKSTGCVCPEWADPVACIDLRYNGFSPGPNSEQPRELRDECQCACHHDVDDEDDDG